ncbi:hypothetical protein HDU97_010317 [Phlyctochytrium planicorne]|nr:hypothetical protein HDU97_010317 [Phlyctochytrium planicorne]
MALGRIPSQNEVTWLAIGSAYESMNEPEKAMAAYDSSLRHNPSSVQALTRIAALCRAREQYVRAVEYFQRIVAIDPSNGEIWGALGHCCLMIDDLQKAYHAYQQALYHLPNPKEPKLWYGIGILYDRYGSYEHAEEAFSAVIRMEPKFDKANEIYFRLGIIYKQQGKYDLSLSCFKYILSYPPKPLTEIDIWFQIGHVYEQQKEYHLARDAYEKVLAENPSHAKVLQQLGWLYHQASSFSNQELAISFLTRSLEADSSDSQTWHILGRCYMAQQKYPKAYEAYQQAVTKDGKNPIFWKDIGVLYFQINQYHDALDAYLRAIYLNPNIAEVWYNLGTLYENCNNQISDAIDAYSKALDLDPYTPHINQRLQMLRQQQATGQPPSAPPLQPYQPAPQDPSTFSSNSNSSIHSGGPPPPSHYFMGPQPPTGMPGPTFTRPPSQELRPVGRPPEIDRKDGVPFPEHLAPNISSSPGYSSGEHAAPPQVFGAPGQRPSSGGRSSPKVASERLKQPIRRPSPQPSELQRQHQQGFQNVYEGHGESKASPSSFGYQNDANRGPPPATQQAGNYHYPAQANFAHQQHQSQHSQQQTHQQSAQPTLAQAPQQPPQQHHLQQQQYTQLGRHPHDRNPDSPASQRPAPILPRGGELMDLDNGSQKRGNPPDVDSGASTPKESKGKGKNSRKSAGNSSATRTKKSSGATGQRSAVSTESQNSPVLESAVAGGSAGVEKQSVKGFANEQFSDRPSSPLPVANNTWNAPLSSEARQPAGSSALSQTIQSVDDNYDDEVPPAFSSTSAVAGRKLEAKDPILPKSSLSVESTSDHHMDDIEEEVVEEGGGTIIPRGAPMPDIHARAQANLQDGGDRVTQPQYSALGGGSEELREEGEIE